MGDNQSKYIKRRPLVLNMMPGLTKCYRERLRNRFSTDLSMRCKTEFENLHQQVKGDCKSLKVRIGQAKQAVMDCNVMAIQETISSVLFIQVSVMVQTVIIG